MYVRPVWAAAFACCAALVSSACDWSPEGASAPDEPTDRAASTGDGLGELEAAAVGTGLNPGGKWTAVGAVASVVPGGGYQGYLCTGTLIAPQWVMTTASCVRDFLIDPGLIEGNWLHFCVGDDCLGKEEGWGAVGDLYRADYVAAYPFYPLQNEVPQSETNVALMRLDRPVEGIAPIDFDIGSAPVNAGTSVVAVSMGGGAQSGKGMLPGHRAAAVFDIIEVYANTIIVENLWPVRSMCLGDWGAPSIYQGEGGPVVVGMHSYLVAGQSAADLCDLESVQVRIAPLGVWIQSVIDNPPVDCTETDSLCECGGECSPAGACEMDACPPTSCRTISNCFFECGKNTACYADCYFRGAAHTREQFDEVFSCAIADGCTNVYQVTDLANLLDSAEFMQCARSNCMEQLEDCRPDLTTESCMTGMTCHINCLGDEECQETCANTVYVDHQPEHVAAVTCFEAECSEVSVFGRLDCFYQSCVDIALDCVNSIDCELGSDECGKKYSCVPVTSERTACFPANTLDEGQLCLMSAPYHEPSCGDGKICLPLSATAEHQGRCSSYCDSNADCFGKTLCRAIPAKLGYPPLNACCLDADEDGYCQFDDCRDLDPLSNAGAEEICYDSIDQDCDGTPDDGCIGGPPEVDPEVEEPAEEGEDNDPPPSDEEPTVDPDEGASSSSGGCSASTPHSPTDASGPWAIGFAMLWMLRRRRRPQP